MNDFSNALQHGTTHAWLFIPSAILLGALHGLEPGHSKTMMAAFIIAIRGTVAQAALLGLSAALSHSLLIWILAAAALHYGSHWNAETSEPYFQIASAVIVVGLALWMLWRTRRDVRAAADHHHHGHGEDHSHDESKVIPTVFGTATLSVFEVGVPPVFRLTFLKDGTPVLPEAAGITIETVRSGGPRQTFAIVQKEGFLESTSEIPEPHCFDLTLRLVQHGHTHEYPAQFREGEHDDSRNHGHHHQHASFATGSDFQDAHELAHAADIQKRFADRHVTTGQIVIFGLTGGLLPCPAAFTVLLICLQLKQFTLGFALVGAFSFGLAITMVTVGVAAAWSVGHAQRKWQGFNELMRRAPYISTILLLLLASYMAWQGWKGLMVHG